MDEFLRFGSSHYYLYLVLLMAGRGLDFLSTWIATPNLVLEGNPIARKMGWKIAIILNVAVCFGLATWPLPAVMLTTTSLLLAARNFQSAWLMHTVGEERYFAWMADRFREASPGVYLFCVLAQTVLIASIGVVLVIFSRAEQLVPFAIGMGMVAHGIVVAVYSFFSMWRIRRPLG
jgi:hypothetical protein